MIGSISTIFELQQAFVDANVRSSFMLPSFYYFSSFFVHVSQSAKTANTIFVYLFIVIIVVHINYFFQRRNLFNHVAFLFPIKCEKGVISNWHSIDNVTVAK